MPRKIAIGHRDSGAKSGQMGSFLRLNGDLSKIKEGEKGKDQISQGEGSFPCNEDLNYHLRLVSGEA